MTEDLESKYTPLDIPRDFDKRAKEVIRELESFDWTFRMSKAGHAIGRAPDGETTTSVSRSMAAGNRAGKNAEAALKAWKRKVEALAIEEVDAFEATVTALEESNGEHSIVDDVLLAGARKHMAKSGAALDALASAPEPLVTEVSRRPWLARKGSHRGTGTTSLYESGAVLEVTFSDGSVAYECVVCDYKSPNPRSVAAHYRGHVLSGEAEPVAQATRTLVARDVPVDSFREREGTPHAYTPSGRLLEALMAYLIDTIGDDLMTAEGVALAALTWFHERPDLDDPEARTTEPLTAEQIVERVRLLVGGRDVETEDSLRVALQANEALRLSLAETETRLDEAVREVTRLAGALDTLSALARGEARIHTARVDTE